MSNIQNRCLLFLILIIVWAGFVGISSIGIYGCNSLDNKSAVKDGGDGGGGEGEDTDLAHEGDVDIDDDGLAPTVQVQLVRVDSNHLDVTARPIPRHVNIELVFSKPMNQESVENAFLLRSDTEARIMGEFHWEDETKVMFMPAASLHYQTVYTIQLTAAAHSIADQALDPVYEQSFVTMTQGDVNGDGEADVAIQSKCASRGASSCVGRIYLYSHQVFTHAYTTGNSIVDINNIGILEGSTPNGYFGSAMTLNADVNADGYADLIVGEPNNPDPIGIALGRGKVYVFSGHDISGSVFLEDAIATIQCSQNQSFFGRSIVSLDDIDNDGRDDFVVGADGFQAPNRNGAGFLFLGSSLVSSMNLTDASAVIQGALAGDRFGYSMANVGDVNADGVSDLLVGAPFVDHDDENAGSVYLFSGATLRGELSANDSAVVIEGTGEGTRFGNSVSAAGDINHDEKADIMVGAPYMAMACFGEGDAGTVPRPKVRGAVYVFSSSFAERVNQVDAALNIACGVNQDDQFGSALAPVGDINKDGFDDIVVGAPGYDEINWPFGGHIEKRDMGAIFIISGQDLTHGAGVAEASLAYLFIRGTVANGMLGSAITIIPDINHDNLMDLLAGAPGESDGEGVVYAMSGRKRDRSYVDTTSSQTFFSITGVQPNDQFGSAFATGGQ